MYRRTVLPNNIRVITNEMNDRESVSFGIWVGVGGRYEDDKNKGSAHFLEHILFKGSKKYSCNQIKELVEGVGGSLNACTAQEFTCYFAKIPAKHLDKTFDILADMVLNPLVSKKDVDKERTVILEEIKMYHDLPQYLVTEALDELIWPGHPLGKNLAGTPETVEALSYLDLRGFHQQHYSSGNIVIAAAGGLKHQRFVRMIKDKFAKLKKEDSSCFFESDGIKKKPKIKFIRKNIEQVHLALGATALNRGHPDRYALNLFNIMLGANMSSRLFNEVREKRGLAYAIASSVKYLQDTGLFMIRAGVDVKKIIEALKVVVNELDKVKKKGFSKSEFTRAKDYYLGQILLELEDTLEHMFWIGESTVSLNATCTLQDVFKEVKRITLHDINRVANEVLQKDKFKLSLVGPLSDQHEGQIRTLLKADS